MFIDRPNIVENSTIVNPTIPSGPTDPANPSIGELFFRTDLNAIRVYGGVTWVEVGKVGLDAHVADGLLHLTPDQNTLLDGLDSTLTSAELNYLDGVTSPIQTQLDAVVTVNDAQTARLDTLENVTIPSASGNLSAHISDNDVHLSADQNTFLDGLTLPTLTSTHANQLIGVTSPIQTQLNTGSANLSTHIADTALHLTAYQNGVLDTLQLEGISGLDLAKMSGAEVGIVGTVADNLTDLQNNKIARNGSVSMTGTLNLGNNRITGILVDASSGPTDAVTKSYVDTLQQGISWKNSVRVASTGNLVLSGLQTVDGVVLVASDRVLVKNQASTPQNGIYLAATGAWSRAPDADQAIELSGLAVFVTDGTAHADTAWVQTQTVSVLNTSSIVFSQFSAAGGAVSGQGILIAGSTISVRNGNGLTFSGNDLTLNFTSQFIFAGSQLDLSDTVSAGTYQSVTVNQKGRVISGFNPTTLSGYGIIDAQPLDDDLTALAALTTTGLIVRTTGTTATTRSLAVAGIGLSIADADGVSGNPTISSNATAANTASTLVARDASGNFNAGTITATSFIGNLTGTATSSNQLGGIAASDYFRYEGFTLDADTMPTRRDGFTYALNAPFTGPIVRMGDAAYSLQFNAPYINGGSLSFRTRNGDSANIFNPWRRVLTESDFNNWAPSLTGLGASGTWTINITGNSASASSVAWGNVSGRPSTIAGLQNTDAIEAEPINRLGSGFYQTPGGVSSIANGWPVDGGWWNLIAATHSNTSNYFSLQLAAPIGANDLRFRSTPNTGAGNWSRVLLDSNFNNWAPSLTGAGASGTWTINITGNSANTSNISNAVGNNYLWTGLNFFRSNGDVGPGSNYQLQAFSDNGSGAVMSFHRAGSYAVNMGLDSDNVFRLGGWSDGANIFRFSIDTAGNFTARGDVIAYSDARLKTDVVTIQDALRKVQQLRGVSYTRIDTGEQSVGLIAQETAQVVKEVVKDVDGYQAVAYGNLTAVLIEAIKELKAQVDALKDEVRQLRE